MGFFNNIGANEFIDGQIRRSADHKILQRYRAEIDKWYTVEPTIGGNLMKKDPLTKKWYSYHPGSGTWEELEKHNRRRGLVIEIPNE